MSAPFTKNGPIVNIFTDIDPNGSPMLKVQYASGKCGYVTSNGITSGNNNEVINIFGTRTITLNTFADLQAYNFKSGVPIDINVLNDEDKGQQNTAYAWTGTTLKWRAEVVDDFQPTI